MIEFVHLRSSRLHFSHFWLDSCISNKGEKFELEMACWMHLEGFQVVSSLFYALLHNSLTGGVDRSDRSGLNCWSYPVSSGVLHAFVQGELHWFRGSLHVCRGSSLCFFKLWFGSLRSLFVLCFVSDVSSRCPCLRGPRLVFFK
jgi:hypothetical protein